MNSKNGGETEGVIGIETMKQTNKLEASEQQDTDSNQKRSKVIKGSMESQKPSNTLIRLMRDVEKANERSKSVMNNDTRKFGGSPAPWG